MINNSRIKNNRNKNTVLKLNKIKKNYKELSWQTDLSSKISKLCKSILDLNYNSTLIQFLSIKGSVQYVFLQRKLGFQLSMYLKSY